MLNILAFMANTDTAAYIWLIVRIVLAVLILVCSGFIIYVVMKQSGNSDGMEAMVGSSSKDDSETFYNKNAGARKEAVLKKWTYICGIALAVCCILFVVFGV